MALGNNRKIEFNKKVSGYMQNKFVSQEHARFLSEIDMEIEDFQKWFKGQDSDNSNAIVTLNRIKQKIINHAKLNVNDAKISNLLKKQLNDIEQISISISQNAASAKNSTEQPVLSELSPATKKVLSSSKNIAAALESKKSNLTDRGVSDSTINQIIEKLKISIPKYAENNTHIADDKMEELYFESILEIYNSVATSNSIIREELNFLLTDKFIEQRSSLLANLTIDKNGNNVTNFLLKKSLDVKSTEGNDQTSSLGKMEGKTTATLYVDKLKIARDSEKDSFYEAIFLQALYGEEFEGLTEKNLVLKKGTLDIASLPTDIVLKKETIEQLAKFRQKYPNVDIKYDLLPQSDKDELDQLLKSSNQSNVIKFNQKAPEKNLESQSDNHSLIKPTSQQLQEAMGKLKKTPSSTVLEPQKVEDILPNKPTSQQLTEAIGKLKKTPSSTAVESRKAESISPNKPTSQQLQEAVGKLKKTPSLNAVEPQKVEDISPNKPTSQQLTEAMGKLKKTPSSTVVDPQKTETIFTATPSLQQQLETAKTKLKKGSISAPTPSKKTETDVTFSFDDILRELDEIDRTSQNESHNINFPAEKTDVIPEGTKSSIESLEEGFKKISGKTTDYELFQRKWDDSATETLKRWELESKEKKIDSQKERASLNHENAVNSTASSRPFAELFSKSTVRVTENNMEPD